MAFIHYILGGKLEIFDKKTKKQGYGSTPASSYPCFLYYDILKESCPVVSNNLISHRCHKHLGKILVHLGCLVGSIILSVV